MLWRHMSQGNTVKSMSAEHKAALAEGRIQGRAVRLYLEALEGHRPKRGRKRTPDSVKRRLIAIESDLKSADPLKRLQLVQERLDLRSEVEAMGAKVDVSAREAGFIAAAKAYSERKGISYAAWRAVDVSPAVLKKAGISRT